MEGEEIQTKLNCPETSAADSYLKASQGEDEEDEVNEEEGGIDARGRCPDHVNV